MGIEIGHHADEERLDLTLEGRLDLTLASGLLQACELIDSRIRTCVIDCTRVTRVFDSGKGLLMQLFDRLEKAGVALIMLGEIPGLRINPALLDDAPAATPMAGARTAQLAARRSRDGSAARSIAAL
jgi:anti-anti-sigma regulatory factor